MDDDEIIPPWDGDEEYPFDDSHEIPNGNVRDSWRHDVGQERKKERKRSLRDHRKGKNKRDNPNY